MRVKKFSSRTVPEALAAVRAEFGEEAVILVLDGVQCTNHCRSLAVFRKPRLPAINFLANMI